MGLGEAVAAALPGVPPPVVPDGAGVGEGGRAPGLLAGFCLVFLTAVTELTATLILAPIGVQTLATQFWAYQTNTAYGAAAPYAVAILLLAAVPNLAIVAWFARRRTVPVTAASPAGAVTAQ